MYDVVILGSGPAGLSASVYAQRAMLKSAVVEKSYMGIGQIAESEKVDNYLGLFGENGYDLGVKFRTHAEKLGAEFKIGEVLEINPTAYGYDILFDDQSIMSTKTIIYALGTERRKLGITGEQEFTGRGVSYCAVCDAAFYKNKTAVVVGGGDTALGDAVLLSKFAEKVYLVHRRNELRANRLLQNKVKEISNIEIKYNAEIKKISGDKTVNKVDVFQDEQLFELCVDGVFVAVGSTPNSALLEGIAELDKNGYVNANENGITSAKGIFVAGDVRTKKLRQVITAVSDGANCVQSVQDYLSSEEL